MTWTSDSDSDSDRDDEPVAAAAPSTPPTAAPVRRRRHRIRRPRAHRRATTTPNEAEDEGVDAEDVWRGLQRDAAAEAWPRRALARPVVVEDAVAGGGVAGVAGVAGVGRARSLTDDDLEELKGCVDLGFGFSYDEIPELCGTLPALELCYSMSQRFLVDDHHHHHSPMLEKKKVEPEEEAEVAAALAPASPAQQPIPNWKISSPGDSPEEVKARLKYWAQAVACTVRLCS